MGTIQKQGDHTISLWNWHVSNNQPKLNNHMIHSTLCLFCLLIDVPVYLKGENQWESSENVELYEVAIKRDIEKLQSALDKGAKQNYIHIHLFLL